jgi:hypothetical protein
VAFTNTPATQRVHLTRIQQDDHAGERRHPQLPGVDSDPRLRTPAAR